MSHLNSNQGKLTTYMKKKQKEMENTHKKLEDSKI
jgi:hypothetical protein